ncbi:staphylococcal nuclease domain-containing protein 1 [Culicoides brevitarsis]|uniref:staphylococcal nuclease domain-containing protein 1 n=1 Tax=Culicoides brevitarsis TaxID=469753 RepID=UPI00307BCDB5
MEKVKQVEAATLKKAIVKQVLSGDSIVVRAQPRGGPPPEKQITLTNVSAPKLGRKVGQSEEVKDEPYAWESREFLRNLLIGKEVYFSFEKELQGNRGYGNVYLDKDGKNNLVHTLVSEGMVTVRRESKSPEVAHLVELEDAAKDAGKGKWGPNAKNAIREVQYTVGDNNKFLEQFKGKQLSAVVEHVRDGSSFRVLLLDSFTYVTLVLSGVRCPTFKLDANGRPDETAIVPYAREAKFFTECRLLNQTVKVVLESATNTYFLGSVIHPKGNIAEALVREGFAKTIDWSLSGFSNDVAEKLRNAEKHAKSQKLKIWENYQEVAAKPNSNKEFQGVCVEVFNGDFIMVKTAGGAKKVYLSSVKPPREVKTEEEQKKRNPRFLYEIPYLYECREFLRKKLVGKKVSCKLDYTNPAKDNQPEKLFYTVMVNGKNIAEDLVAQGLATVIRYRQDNDQRSSHYNDLLNAEGNAAKEGKGVHSKKDQTTIRLVDLTVDTSKIRHQYLPSWQRALKMDAIVEFVASGSRFRIFIQKDNVLVNFLLMGISCPRSSRPAINGQPAVEGDPFGNEALEYVKEKIYQRDVTVQVETTDKGFNSVIGWLFTENKQNLSVLLVEQGLATLHNASAEKSEHYRTLKMAEDKAKAKRLNLWKNYVEQEEVEGGDETAVEATQVFDNAEKSMEEVTVTEVSPDMQFFVQKTKEAAKLTALMEKVSAHVKTATSGSLSFKPKRGDVCASKFEDGQWYRCKVERMQGENASILYIDYGNRDTVKVSNLLELPHSLKTETPYATLCKLAYVTLPVDAEDKKEALNAFVSDVLDKKLNMAVQYRSAGVPHCTLHTLEDKSDVGKNLVIDGFVLLEKKRELQSQKLFTVYKEEEEKARKAHMGIWRYGDITEDDEQLK